MPPSSYRHAMDLAPPTQPSEPAFITYINSKMSPFSDGKFAVKLRNTFKLAKIKNSQGFQKVAWTERDNKRDHSRHPAGDPLGVGDH